MPNLDLINQEFNELRYNRRHIDSKIRESIEKNPVMLDRIDKGVDYLKQWIDLEHLSPKKRERIEQIRALDMRELVVNVFVGIAYFQRPELFTSVTAQLAFRVGLTDRVDAITTMAEICAVLCWTDAFDINKDSRMASLVVISRIILEPALIEFIEESQYLPPMVCEPRKLTNNYSSGYLTHNESLILRNNHHDGDICLDVLNTMNAVPLRLNVEMLCQFEEEPTFELDTPEKKEQWVNFKKQSYRFYELLVSQGNRFWLTHKVDKRGRIYSQGYHVNTQGASFKKAMVQLAEGEYVTGVPNF